MTRSALFSQLAVAALFVAVLGAACGNDNSLPGYQPDGSGWDRDAAGQDGSAPSPDFGDDANVPPDDGSRDDVRPGTDTGTPRDVPDGMDVPMPPDIPDVPLPFSLVSAFSADGATITVRFSREVDAASGSQVGNFEFLQGASPFADFTSATVDGRFVRLTLAPGTNIDPDYSYEVRATDVLAVDGEAIDPLKNRAVVKRSVYLAIVWHQHQPLYSDALKDELQGPWVRKHATKDYYDMASVLEPYPEVHVTINLTIVMLNQLIGYYLDRLGPYVDVVNNRVDEEAFLARWKGKTDPWIDLLLEDTPTPQTATEKQLGLLYADPWACVSTNPGVLARFPEYEAVRYKNPAELTQDDYRVLKIMFELAWIDPEFLDGPVPMPDGTVVDLSDVIGKGADGKYRMKVPFTEELANRIVAEEYKIMANVVAIHKQFRYDPDDYTGQIEIATTPYYHPILPLVFDTELASVASGGMARPSPSYSYPEDARAQVLRAVGYYERVFGEPPRGMWPGEGSVAEDIVPILVSEGIDLTWVATGQEVLQCSTPGGQPHYVPYRIDGDTANGDGGTIDDEMIIVFRDPVLSDRIGFTYQSYEPQRAVDDFIGSVLAQAPRFGAPDRMVTVVLDGENAWESYTKDHDAKNFFRILYSTLDRSSRDGEIVAVTPTEYVTGNPTRGIPGHSIHDQKELEPLWAGSWIAWEKNDADPCANYEVWIGESEENKAWEYLARARADLAASGLTAPNPRHGEPERERDELFWNTWKAFDEIYAAEGSDWFWWYGGDMTTPANNDSPFDIAYRAHLVAMYSYMNTALAILGRDPIPAPDVPPIIQALPIVPSGPFTNPPTIDGQLAPSQAEWLEQGGSFTDRDSGAMHNPNDDVTEIYYGYTNDAFYAAIVSTETFADKLGEDYDISLYFSQKHILDAEAGTVAPEEPANRTTAGGHAFEFKDTGATWRLELDFSGAALVAKLHKANGSGGWTAVGTHQIVVGGPRPNGQVLELKVPLANLGIAMGDPLEFMLAVTEAGDEIDLAPNEDFGSYQVFEDATALVYVTFEVDASGREVDLQSYTNPLCVLPQNGGIIYITGNHKELGLRGDDWWPNKVALVDNGQDPDTQATDQIWSLRKKFSRGFYLKYKYTSGQPQYEGQWGCTEEFPVTRRGWLIPENPNLARVTIRDVFADKAPGGADDQLGSRTELVCEDRGGNVIDCE